VWGTPDLVAEILSPRTEKHDRGEKLGWYRGVDSIRSAVLPELESSAFGIFS
jgi:Uma2 family endonuclease